MPNELPTPIINDNDLSFYEDYLKTEFQETNQKPKDCLEQFLKSLVKIDFGNSSLVGTLEEIGQDFLIISHSRRKTAVARNHIKFVRILQNSINSPYF